MRLLVGASVLATATACGAKHTDPYAASLAKGSEHVEVRGVVAGRRVVATGDFVGDRGRLTVRDGKALPFHEVIVGRRVYLNVGGSWVHSAVAGIVTPDDVFRRRMPAHIADGLVRSVTLRAQGGRETITFSRYGEHVSVTVPRVKGS